MEDPGGMAECLAALDILCQGYLLIVGAVRDNSGDLQRTFGPDATLLAQREVKQHADKVQRVVEWFTPATKAIRQIVAGHRDPDILWEDARRDRGVHASVLKPIRDLFYSLEKTEDTITPDWEAMVQGAHAAYQKLEKGGFL